MAGVQAHQWALGTPCEGSAACGTSPEQPARRPGPARHPVARTPGSGTSGATGSRCPAGTGRRCRSPSTTARGRARRRRCSRCCSSTTCTPSSASIGDQAKANPSLGPQGGRRRPRAVRPQPRPRPRHGPQGAGVRGRRGRDGLDQRPTGGTAGHAGPLLPAAGRHLGPGRRPRHARHDLDPLRWSDDPRDWSRPGSLASCGASSPGCTPGVVVLMHDGGGDRSRVGRGAPVPARTRSSPPAGSRSSRRT